MKWDENAKTLNGRVRLRAQWRNHLREGSHLTLSRGRKEKKSAFLCSESDTERATAEERKGRQGVRMQLATAPHIHRLQKPACSQLQSSEPFPIFA